MVILTILWSGPNAPALRPPVPEASAPPRVSQKVFLPPPSVLRQLPQARPTSPPPPLAPRAPATPTPPPVKDRVSIGAPSELRAKGPLVLRREDDLTAVAKGRPDALPSVPPATPAPEPTPTGGGAPETQGRPGLRMPPGVDGLAPSGDGGERPRPGPSGPSIASSLRNLDSRLQTQGTQGLPTGTGKQMGPLFFDPQGADFTLWVNHFKNEVYRNWIVPQPALLGFRGHVDLEFSVERDGRLTNLRLLKSSGTPALDRAAQNALIGSRLLPLPADFGPPRVQMQVTFFYNEAPQSS
jgi:protein TonB